VIRHEERLRRWRQGDQDETGGIVMSDDLWRRQCSYRLMENPIYIGSRKAACCLTRHGKLDQAL
jgi:hypothetical protein